MKKVIKHQKKMKNTMYIVFGIFALALFGITMLNPSYAEEGLILDDALDAIMQGTVMNSSGGFEKVEEEKMIQPVGDVEGEDEDVVEPEVISDEEIEGGEGEDSQDLEELDLEGKGEDEEENVDETVEDKGQTEEDKGVDSGDNSVNEESHGVSNKNMDKGEEYLGDFGFQKSNNTDFELMNNNFTVTFNLNGGYWSEETDETTKYEERQITSNGNEIGVLEWKTPSKEGNSCNGKKCMFDGWYYTGLENRWTGYVNEDMTVYAKWLEFEDLTVVIGGVEITIMDRNLGATDPNINSNSSRGYAFQWGNNYGFKVDTSTIMFPNGEKTSDSMVEFSKNYVSNYYNGVRSTNTGNWFIYREEDKNLWGRGSYDNYDEDSQGPCPKGYHVPSYSERYRMYQLNNWNNDLRTRLNLPYTYSYSSYNNSVATNRADYWGATDGVLVYGHDYGNGYVGKFLYTDGSRSTSFSFSSQLNAVRCFKDSKQNNIVLNSKGGTIVETQFRTKRRRESRKYLPDIKVMKKDNYIFDGWYKSENYNESEKVTTNEITSDDDLDIVLYAKWRNPINKIVTYDANGGYFNGDINISDKDIIYFEQSDGSFVPESTIDNPDRESNALSIQSGWMFDGWYTISGNRMNQTEEYKLTDQKIKEAGTSLTVYAKWLPFNDLILTLSGVDFKLMDRNLLASAYYGEGGKESKDREGKFYSRKSLGLEQGNYIDKNVQGPCPNGYHVPNINELNFLIEHFKSEINNNFCEGMSEKECILTKLKIPSAGRNNSYGVRYDNNKAFLLSSSFEKGESYDKVYVFSTEWSSSYIGNFNGSFLRGEAPIRCFKENENKNILTAFPNNGEDKQEYELELWEPILENLNEPTFKGRAFSGWYYYGTNDKVQQLDKADNNVSIEGKWNKNPWYYYNANGGIFVDGKALMVQKYDYNKNQKMKFNQSENSAVDIKRYEYTITGASKLHVTIEQTKYPGYLEIYGYDGRKNDDTITDDYVYINGSNYEENFDIVGDTLVIIVNQMGPSLYMDVIIDAEFSYTTNEEILIPNYSGYKFLGRYESGTTQPFDFTGTEVTQDRTFYAKWEGKPYTVTFDTDGGSEMDPIIVKCGEKISAQTPTKDCNEFSGWDIELPETMPSHDITLKAIWNYTCSRSSGGGGSKKSEPTTREITIDTPTEQEHNSANEEQKSETSETSNTPTNGETTHQVISVTQEISEDGTPIEVVVETVKIKNTDIVATVRTEVSTASSSSSSSSSTTHTKEQNDAYSFAKSNGITTTSSIEDAKMNTELTRIQMAKMLSNFAINVLGQEPDPEKGIVKFDDVTNKMDKQYDNAVTKAYQLGIMGQNVKNNEFRPNDTVTRAEFASALSRLLYHTEEGNYKGTGKYYIPHVAKLYNEGIINKTDPKIKEKRGYVMLMLMRTVQ